MAEAAAQHVTSRPPPRWRPQELQEADLGHGGRGGARGEAIALVLAVMAEKCAGDASRCPEGFRNQRLRFSRPTCLVLTLRHARQSAGHGVRRHAAYIASLPTNLPGMPMFWDGEQTELLAGTAVGEKLHGVGAAGAALPSWGPVIEPPMRVNAPSA